MESTLVKKDRDAIFFDFTRSICPNCKRLVDAQILVKQNKVYMRKRCPDHGWFECILSSNAEMYIRALKFNKPGTLPLKFSTEVRDGCPYDCGLCPEHQQHTCVGIIEVTETCNLRCPTCFSDSTVGRHLTLNEIEFMLDEFVRCEGNPEIIQFSGGEPTVHPQILEILRRAKERNFKVVMLNTNGVRIANDPTFTESLADLNPTIYFQFDGFKESTHLALRGEDLRDVKNRALARMQELSIPVVLVATVQRGVNEDELGQLVDFALETNGVKGIVFQPAFYEGRHPSFDPLDRVTLADVVRNLVSQSKYGFKETDFVAIPCCFPNCSTATYVYMEEGKAIPLTRVVDVEEYLDYFKNRTFVDLNDIVKGSLESLYSLGSVAGSEKMMTSYCTACGIPVDIKSIQDKVKMIMIQPFMDAYNFDVKRVMKCCVAEIMPDGRIIPFCAYNTLYRR